jgi:hypothetical protein
MEQVRPFGLLGALENTLACTGDGVLKAILQFFNRDLTGRTWERQVEHPYFTSLVYFGARDVKSAYWEAQVPSDGGGFLAYLRSPAEGPSPVEVEFCRTIAGAPAQLSARCAPLIAGETGRTVNPADLRIESIELPEGGDERGEWEVTFDLADESFAVRMKAGMPVGVARAG